MPTRREDALRLASGGRVYVDGPHGPSWTAVVVLCLVSASVAAAGVLWLVRW
jgi:hypothetical protein